MPSQIIIVRHGHTPNNFADHRARMMGWTNDTTGLSDAGRLDATATAAKLKSYRIDAAYHSDLLRTTETAQIISETLQIQITPTPLLRERNIGNFAGHSHGELAENRPADWAKFLDHHDLDWNGLEGESLRDVHNRFHQLKNNLSQSHVNQSVLLVTHSGFIHTVLRDIFGFFPKESFIEVNHDSVTILEKQSNSYILSRYNE